MSKKARQHIKLEIVSGTASILLGLIAIVANILANKYSVLVYVFGSGVMVFGLLSVITYSIGRNSKSFVSNITATIDERSELIVDKAARMTFHATQYFLTVLLILGQFITINFSVALLFIMAFMAATNFVAYFYYEKKI